MPTLKTLGSLKVNGEGCVSFNIPETLLRVLTLLILRVNTQVMKSFSAYRARASREVFLTFVRNQALE